ncbi:hypothetical protein AA0229_2685 [Gluconobacter cerinus NRIC 0229]|nr:hypothetical protein AA0229_2685 [Gluconobacter cerinus NRIC 0229]
MNTAQEPDKDRGAECCGNYANRQFRRSRDQSGNRISRSEKNSPKKSAPRQNQTVVWTGDQPHKMRNHNANKPNGAYKRDYRPNGRSHPQHCEPFCPLDRIPHQSSIRFTKKHGVQRNSETCRNHACKDKKWREQANTFPICP